MLDINIYSYIFSGISLLMTTYVDRFNKISVLIREKIDKKDRFKIEILYKRINYIKRIMFFSIFSLIFDILTILSNIFIEKIVLYFFIVSIINILIAFYYLIKEILLSNEYTFSYLEK
ncbi:uncharacterized protein DUF2721 [Hypnocyclicus thermotrophus]|uniref:Uncharacterized protein DUF2721 n=1 Tax=Hypnocyclicus thermotrophus TaxID=1627895 RepID=A0AA46DYF2_9FUSO|nr:DUF2721 domain-containing protein [Hypnocyclicus thermotrophus]TDT69814.1 uncharacterized protein DUF2721 [Hypnocyclicus thermotrophus]